METFREHFNSKGEIIKSFTERINSTLVTKDKKAIYFTMTMNGQVICGIEVFKNDGELFARHFRNSIEEGHVVTESARVHGQTLEEQATVAAVIATDYIDYMQEQCDDLGVLVVY